jgi:hypothetical protein
VGGGSPIAIICATMFIFAKDYKYLYAKKTGSLDTFGDVMLTEFFYAVCEANFLRANPTIFYNKC